MASTGAIRKYLTDHPADFDPRKYLKAATKGMKQICRDRYEAFGTAGNASRIKPITLEDMYKRYASGELDPRVN
jgi:fructose-bisphosphate aldolase class II